MGRVANPLIRTVEPSPDARVIFVGDIHGCYDELLELLERVAPRPNDVVISTGDIVNKGPDPARCLDVWKTRGFHAVLGNNERKLLRARPVLQLFTPAADREVLRRRDLVSYIASWPLVLDIPSRGLAAVHGGFLPQMRVTPEDVARYAGEIDHLRWIRNVNGTWVAIQKDRKEPDDVLWAEQWNGDRFAVYGHTPLRKPRRDSRALGLDTGCVYGRALTAAIHSAKGAWSFVSVPAKCAYAE